MPAHRKTTVLQITVMIEYFEKNRHVNTAEKTEIHHWETLAKMLNRLPGETKDSYKWRNYWNELKSQIRRKARENWGMLLPYEKRVLNLVGTLDDNRPVRPRIKKIRRKKTDEKKSEQDHNNAEHEYSNTKQNQKNLEQNYNSLEQDQNNSEQVQNNSENDQNNSEQDQNNSEQDDNNSDQDHNTSVSKGVSSDQDERPEEVDLKDNIILPNAEVPEWVHKVEHSRLQLEERTTAAIEQMAVGITSIAESLRGVVASLHNIEESIRSLKRKD